MWRARREIERLQSSEGIRNDPALESPWGFSTLIPVWNPPMRTFSYAWVHGSLDSTGGSLELLRRLSAVSSAFQDFVILSMRAGERADGTANG